MTCVSPPPPPCLLHSNPPHVHLSQYARRLGDGRSFSCGRSFSYILLGRFPSYTLHGCYLCCTLLATTCGVCMCVCLCVCVRACVILRRVPPACTHTYTPCARGVGGGEDSCYTYATSSKLLPLLSSPKNSAKMICEPRLSFSLPPRSLVVAPSLSFLLRNDLSSHPILFLFSFSLSFSFSFDLSRHLLSSLSCSLRNDFSLRVRLPLALSLSVSKTICKPRLSLSRPLSLSSSLLWLCLSLFSRFALSLCLLSHSLELSHVLC